VSVGPSANLIVAVAAAFGLLAGLAMAVLRHRCATTIRTARDLARLPSAVPVLATLPRVHAPIRWMS
jgi:capsular polysaccharide biosynthesis protein